jgi:hypothetical protein
MASAASDKPLDSSSECSIPESPGSVDSLASPLTRQSSYEFPNNVDPNSLLPQLGNVLVVGGCGFLGHHVVKFLLNEPTVTSISVMCRSPFKNKFDGVDYHIGDVTKFDHCRHVLEQVKPKVIFNTASPHAYKE